MGLVYLNNSEREIIKSYIPHNNFAIIPTFRDPAYREKASRSVQPDKKKPRESMFLRFKVSLILKRSRYCLRPVTVDDPPIMRLSNANRLIACSALLLFQGTPS